MILDDMANASRNQLAQRQSNQIRSRAEHAHGRTCALASAAMAELRRVDPDNAIHVTQVQDHVMKIGGATIDRSSTFAPVWQLEFDLRAILREINDVYESNRTWTLNILSQPPTVKTGWFGKKSWHIAGCSFESEQDAELARLRATAKANAAVVGKPLDLTTLLEGK